MIISNKMMKILIRKHKIEIIKIFKNKCMISKNKINNKFKQILKIILHQIISFKKIIKFKIKIKMIIINLSYNNNFKTKNLISNNNNKIQQKYKKIMIKLNKIINNNNKMLLT